MSLLPYRIAEANEALIITGARASKDGDTDYKIVVGHGCWVTPFFRKARVLGLQAHETVIEENVYTKTGIPLGVRAVVVFKVGSDAASIANAAQRFLQNEQDMDAKAHNIFAGHLRSIVGAMEPEEILRERTKLAEEVRASSADEMQKLGLMIDSFQIQDLNDPTKYIEQLAAPHQANVRSLARIAEADADLNATAREQEVAAQNAKATADSQVLQAEQTARSSEAEAKSNQAGPLATAEAKMAVVKQETEVASLEAERAQQQLLIDVVRPAEAQRDADIAAADGRKKVTVLAAEADAERVKLGAAADAEKTRVLGEAEADRERAVGQAKGDARKAELLAEADGLHARADALAENQDAVISQQVADKLPDIVGKAAEVFKGIDNLVVLNGGDGMNSLFKDALGMGLAALPMIRSALSSNGDKKQDDVPASTT